jgi:hypothetical protein
MMGNFHRKNKKKTRHALRFLTGVRVQRQLSSALSFQHLPTEQIKIRTGSQVIQ